MTTLVDVPALCRLVEHVGIDKFIAGMAATIREDFQRWQAAA